MLRLKLASNSYERISLTGVLGKESVFVANKRRKDVRQGGVKEGN